MNTIFYSLSIVLLLVMVGCKDNSAASSHATEIIEDSNGFIDFYHKFHTDSAFQMAHIRFPLEGVPSVADSVYDGKGKYFHKKENWTIHRPIDTSTGEFKREFDIGDVLVTERIVNQQNFMLVRRFYYDGNAWNLIYYADMNPVR